MFSLLVICYLFLCGAAAAGLVLLSMLVIIQPDDTLHELFMRAFPVCFIVLALGLLCLLVDLGRPDRLFNLLFYPRFSAISLGAYALVFSLACAAFFSIIELFEWYYLSRPLIIGVAVFGILVGTSTMVYTGVLLQSTPSVLFWNTPLLTILFVLSSASTGCALVFGCTSFVETNQSPMPLLSRLTWVDLGIITLELVVLVAYMLNMMSDEVTCASVAELIAGEYAWMFWGGIVACGLLLPAFLEKLVNGFNRKTLMLCVAALILVGGFFIRYCIVGAGSFDVTQTQEISKWLM